MASRPRHAASRSGVLSWGARAAAPARRTAPAVLTVRYALLFVLAAAALTVGAIATFDHISATALAVESPPAMSAPADTVLASVVTAPVVASTADYDKYAAEDRAWR